MSAPRIQLIADDAIAIVTILQEAEGEPFEGKLAVAEVILSRTRHRYNSDGTIMGTCLAPLQFSGWNSKSTNRIRTMRCCEADPMVADCVRAWNLATAGSSTVQGALLYYSPATLVALGVPAPDWASPLKSKQVATVGHHIFFVPLV